MPTLNIDISEAKSFTNLPEGEYEGEIQGIFEQAPREQGKFGKLRVQYVVIDGAELGRVSSEFLPLDPKLTGFLVAWMKKFGEWEDIEPAELKELAWETDEAGELIDPDLAGTRVIFKVYEKKGYVNTELVEVLDEVDVSTAAATTDDADDADDADDPAEDAEEAPKAAAPAPRASRPVRTAAAPKTQRRSLR